MYFLGMPRRRLMLALLLLSSLAQAMGHRDRDAEEKDKFPDYNRLEYAKPIPKEPETSLPARTVAPPPVPTASSSTVPDAPLPPPKVVPMPADPSEPSFPSEVLDTISSSSTV